MSSILVGVKRVVDYNVRVRPKPDGSGVAVEGVKMSVNPFDEIALEEALRIRDAGHAKEVIAISIGLADAQSQLRNALAMGADRAVLLQCDDATVLSPLVVAQAFRCMLDKLDPTLVIFGKQAIDEDHGQTGQMLAALWDRPQATYASKVEISGSVARVTREIDSGSETIEVELPAVITVDLRLNEPRYIKLPDIMKAKKKPLDVISLESLKVSTPKTTPMAIRFSPPAERAKGIMVTSVSELVSAMRTRGVLP